VLARINTPNTHLQKCQAKKRNQTNNTPKRNTQKKYESEGFATPSNASVSVVTSYAVQRN
jgi:hypothetical protein